MTTVTELKGNVKLSSDEGATTTIGGILNSNDIRPISGNLFLNTSGTCITNNINANLVTIYSNPADSENSLTFNRNGQFTMGINAVSTPTLIMGTENNGVEMKGSVTMGTIAGTSTIRMNKPITIGYSIPLLESQLGYSIRSAPPLDVQLATGNNGTEIAKIITGFTLPIGTWMCSYQIRYTTTGLTTFTQLQTYMLLPIAAWHSNNGWIVNRASQKLDAQDPSSKLVVCGSGIIHNNISQTLNLYDASTYTGTALLYAVGGNAQTYLIATRIA